MNDEITDIMHLALYNVKHSCHVFGNVISLLSCQTYLLPPAVHDASVVLIKFMHTYVLLEIPYCVLVLLYKQPRESEEACVMNRIYWCNECHYIKCKTFVSCIWIRYSPYFTRHIIQIHRPSYATWFKYNFTPSEYHLKYYSTDSNQTSRSKTNIECPFEVLRIQFPCQRPQI
jgi:hypothetical protein